MPSVTSLQWAPVSSLRKMPTRTTAAKRRFGFPGSPTKSLIGRAQHPNAFSSVSPETAHPAAPSEESLMGVVGWIEFERSDRERRQSIGQRRPVRAGGGGIGGAPNAAVYRADIKDVRI